MQISNFMRLKSMAKNLSVLYVEDDDMLRESLTIYLKKIFDDVRSCCNGVEGFLEYEKRGADIVVSDIMMPKLNGIEMIRKIKSIKPNQDFIIISAHTESQNLMEAIRLGVGHYIIKPIEHEQIVGVLIATVTRIIQERENKEYKENLERLVDTKIKEYKELEDEKIKNYEQTLYALVKLIERRDSYTAGHSQRVSQYCVMIARQMGLKKYEVELLEKAAILHDIGKIATPDAILLKPDRLDNIERELIKEHVNVGVDMLSDVEMFKDMAFVIAAHHERYDGGGYPRGIGGDDIPFLSRIMSIADAFDAMTTNRIYKSRKNIDEAMVELKNLSKLQFDPSIVPFAVEALKNVELKDTSQLPKTILEEERFVYFFKDHVTNLYNQGYLNVLLMKNNFNFTYKCLHCISLHKFSEYNKKYGWDRGNQFLRQFGDFIREKFNNSTIFRVHANDFIILSKEHIDFNYLDIVNLNILNDNFITCSFNHIDIEKDQIFELESLNTKLFR